MEDNKLEDNKLEDNKLEEYELILSRESLLYLSRHYRPEVAPDLVEGVRFCGKFQISKSQWGEAPLLLRRYEKQARRLCARARSFSRQLGVTFNQLQPAHYQSPCVCSGLPDRS